MKNTASLGRQRSISCRHIFKVAPRLDCSSVMPHRKSTSITPTTQTPNPKFAPVANPDFAKNFSRLTPFDGRQPRSHFLWGYAPHARANPDSMSELESTMFQNPRNFRCVTVRVVVATRYRYASVNLLNILQKSRFLKHRTLTSVPPHSYLTLA